MFSSSKSPQDAAFEQIFQLKFTTKQLERSAKRADKESDKAKAKVAASLRKGSPEAARIYAGDAVRKHKEAVSYLRWAAKVDTVRQRVEAMQVTKTVVGQLESVTKMVDKALEAQDLAKLSMTMEQFEAKFEDLEVRDAFVEDALNSGTATMSDPDAVDDLLKQTAAEINLDISTLLPDATGALPEQQREGVRQTQGPGKARAAGERV